MHCYERELCQNMFLTCVIINNFLMNVKLLMFLHNHFSLGRRSYFTMLCLEKIFVRTKARCLIQEWPTALIVKGLRGGARSHYRSEILDARHLHNAAQRRGVSNLRFDESRVTADSWSGTIKSMVFLWAFGNANSLR